jgi:Ser-tRNA(Ala) deacylase AlaX
MGTSLKAHRFCARFEAAKMTARLYLDSAELTGEARVVEITPGDASTVRLDQTLFHPRGGGQPADRGALSLADHSGITVPVSDVRNADDGGVDHVLAGVAPLKCGDRVLMHVDADSRRLHARLHSAGHLVALAAERIESGLRSISGHHWPGEARVEFEGLIANVEDFEAALLSKLEEMRAANLPIRASLDGSGRRSIAIDPTVPVPCGGTHVADTAAIGRVYIRKIKSKGSRVRVSYDIES